MFIILTRGSCVLNIDIIAQNRVNTTKIVERSKIAELRKTAESCCAGIARVGLFW